MAGALELAQTVCNRAVRAAPARRDGDKLLAQISIRPEATILEAMQAINRGGVEMAVAVDEAGRLVGIVTDGDIRRAILGGCTKDSPVAEALNRRPLCLPVSADREQLLAVMGRHGVRQLPLIDSAGRVCRIAWITDLIRTDLKPNRAVVMAGGKGTRLYPLTRNLPKPMLEVEGRPILQHIIESLREHGLFRITVSVNHLRDVIIDYFGRGERFGVQIDYIHEDRPLGTAGALGLLPEKPAHPLVVLNGDLLQGVNFESLLRFHDSGQFQATVCCVRHMVELPFGVVQTRGNRMVGLTEKPAQTVTINAGIYVLNPAVLDLLEPGQPADMTDLLHRLLEAGKSVGVFTLLGHERWLDIGHRRDYENARCGYDRR